MSRKIKTVLKEKKHFFETEGLKLFPELVSNVDILKESMLYSLNAGGKRIRPVLSLLVTEMLGKDQRDILPACLSIEMIHTYSLIHDDLPSMDNDDFRRGKPTNHKQFGEAVAILAGDALLTEAFHVCSRYPEKSTLTQGKLALIRELSKAAGANGMVGGQVMDMEHPEGEGIDYLKDLHRRKTGEMIKISCLAPVYLFDEGDRVLSALSDYADRIGLLFQVADDILDATSTLEELGKTPGKDDSQGKLTYVTLFGLEEARSLADALVQEAVKALDTLADYDTGNLKDIAGYIADRTT